MGEQPTKATKATKASKSMKVDMVATARDVQWSADTFLGFGSVKLVAPAKVNLFLGVGERRADGYHDVVNVMQATALHDVLYLNATPVVRGGEDERWLNQAQAQAEAQEAQQGQAQEAQGAQQQESAQRELPPHLAIGGPQDNLLVMIDCADKGDVGALDVPARDNIVFKAVHLLACEMGRTAREKVDVRLEKHIPHQGGLGGGSSDAAAALLGAAKLWGIAPDDPVIEQVACRLGSDVAFFLHGGCALFDGAGESFVRALAPRKDAILLIKPQGGVSTAAAYAAFDESFTPIDEALLDQALSAESACDIPLFNNLTSAAESLMPELSEVRQWALAQPGVRDVLLCGSGATTCAVVEDFATACALAAKAQLNGWWARATMFSSLKAAVRPR